MVEIDFLKPKDATPIKLQGMGGSKKALQSNESKASCMELKKCIYRSSERLMENSVLLLRLGVAKPS